MQSRLRKYSNVVMILAGFCYIVGVAATTYSFWLSLLLFPLLVAIAVTLILFVELSKPPEKEGTADEDVTFW